jgi:hypothetical protein
MNLYIFENKTLKRNPHSLLKFRFEIVLDLGGQQGSMVSRGEV